MKSVFLRFQGVDLENHHKKGVTVEVIDVKTRDTVYGGSLEQVFKWLRRNHLSYIPGTTGWYARRARDWFRGVPPSRKGLVPT